MILVTGGAGFIGSHFCSILKRNNYDFLIIDNFCNSKKDNIIKLETLIGEHVELIEGDIRDKKKLTSIFKNYNISSVVHFAGLKSVNNSFKFPLEYYSSNVVGTINLIETMLEWNIKKIIFSSSATVYNKDLALPWKENLILNLPENPYAQTKFIIEKFLYNIYRVNKKMRIGILRYFNPIGADKSGIIGEHFDAQSTNLIPSMINVYLGKIDHLKVYGTNFDTHDGYGVRDFIHVEDLVEGHLRALEYLEINSGYYNWNLGTGIGHSVLDVIQAFEKISKFKLPIQICSRRKGDLDKYWADVSKAEEELGFTAKKTLEEMIEDTIRFADRN